MNFTQDDVAYIQSLGIQEKEVEKQLQRFVNGFPDIQLFDTVSAGNGLRILNQNDLRQSIQRYDAKSIDKKLLKFVPASGAASRMFKLLYNYLDGSVSRENPEIDVFYTQLNDFAFSEELLATLDSATLSKKIETRDKSIVEQLLTRTGLNYGELPKALLSFHTYPDGNITKAIDEHLVEGALYCGDNKECIELHFTVSEEHLPLIKDYLLTSVKKFEKRFHKKYNLSFSIQDIATNTIAVNKNNQPFRLEDGTLLFRPGGHGALLTNLNERDADIVFIKNIDNVAAEWLLEDTITYKKALGGVLLEIQGQLFDYCRQLESLTTLDTSLEQEIVEFLGNHLGFKVPDIFNQEHPIEKINFLLGKLNRPLRVCGVVEAKNTGGGPFWVKHVDGSESLQLVETAQVNLSDPKQVQILQSSHYANITDLVCGLKNYKGEKFDLMQHRDSETGFIAEKSFGSKTLKAMELPGLWNGAMSDWNTIFVEVPMSTFNPVKTVMDLLKKEHQGIH